MGTLTQRAHALFALDWFAMHASRGLSAHGQFGSLTGGRRKRLWWTVSCAAEVPMPVGRVTTANVTSLWLSAANDGAPARARTKADAVSMHTSDGETSDEASGYAAYVRTNVHLVDVPDQNAAAASSSDGAAMAVLARGVPPLKLLRTKEVGVASVLSSASTTSGVRFLGQRASYDEVYDTEHEQQCVVVECEEGACITYGINYPEFRCATHHACALSVCVLNTA